MSVNLSQIPNYSLLMRQSIHHFEKKYQCRTYDFFLDKLELHKDSINITGDTSFKTSVFKWIKEIGHYPIGRRILLHFLLSVQKLEIVAGDSDTHQGNKITLNPKVRSYYYTLNSANELVLIRWRKSIILFHEWVHYHREKILNFQATGKAATIGSNFPDLEEQTTTCGLFLDSEGKYQCTPICENGIDFFFQYPLRMNYSCVNLPKGVAPNLVDLIFSKAFGSLKSALLQPGVKVNEPLHLQIYGNCSKIANFEEFKTKKVTPLSTTIYLENLKMVRLLLSSGADVFAKDDLGGPESVVKKCRNLEIKALIEKEIEQKITNTISTSSILTSFFLSYISCYEV